MMEDKLQFDEATHTYTVGDRILPSVTELCAPLQHSGKYDNAVAAYAAARGTRIHELCALYDLDALPDEIEAECAGYVQAWAAFCRDYRPNWERIEWAGFAEGKSFPCNFAGTADRIGVIDGKRIVVDIKTASSLDRPAKVALCCQLRGYTEIAWSSGINITGPGMGVQLRKDGTYTVHLQEKIEQRYGFRASDLLECLCEIYNATKGERYV